MEYIFSWSKDLDKVINYNINDNFINNSDNYDSLAIIVIGQLRGFFDIFDKFKILIDRLKLVFPKVVIFFYITTDVMYSWRVKNNSDKLKHLKSKYNHSIDDFKKVISEIQCEYIIKEKKENKHNNTHLSQLYDINLCHLDIYEYEKNNNFKFNYILKTRPDVYLVILKFNFKNIFSKDIFYYNWDLVYTYPRDFSILFDIFVNEIKKDHTLYNNIIITYTNAIPTGYITKDTNMLLNHFAFIISTQYLKALKYKDIHIFKCD